MTFYEVEMLHRHTTYILDWKLSFPVQLILIGNFHFEFILILSRDLISQKSCDKSIFSLHMVADKLTMWLLLHTGLRSAVVDDPTQFEK